MFELGLMRFLVFSLLMLLVVYVIFALPVDLDLEKNIHR